ncbi:hypothetical protein RDWZM_007404 [Blomia tropicalis]|uniref:Uncharacterized protein n=1 Tax=Blomia tropicalis TaxID=40697 RepID=A0A9Q0LZU0_BLOTA|nr:hypothetical protein RDWZM_007404 [Blomia tropicalis]
MKHTLKLMATLVLALWFGSTAYALFLERDGEQTTYLNPSYGRHSPSRPQSSGISLKSLKQSDSSPQPMFMIDFKRHTIVTHEETEKESHGEPSNHSLIEKYIINPNGQEYPYKLVNVEKRPQYFLSQPMSSSKSVQSIPKIEEDESHGRKSHQKFLPFDAINYRHLVAAKAVSEPKHSAMELEKKDNIKYALSSEEKPNSSEEQFNTFTMTDEKAIKNLHHQLKQSLENFLGQLNHLKQNAEQELKKMSQQQQQQPEIEPQSSRLSYKVPMYYGKDYDNDLRHYISMAKLASYDSP